MIPAPLKDGPFRSEYGGDPAWGVRFKGRDTGIRFGTAHEAGRMFNDLVYLNQHPQPRTRPSAPARPERRRGGWRW